MPDFPYLLDLTPEETYLWQCARGWREPGLLAEPATLDWQRLVAVGQSNRMQTLLYGVLSATDRLARLTAEARDGLQQDVDKLAQDAKVMSQSLRQYLDLAAARNLETVVMKGLSVSTNIYDNPAMRPGGDIDLLVRREQVDESVAILEDMGLGRWWPNLLDDRYYDRHHLHQQRCSKDLRLWYEIHWALDHPYTLLTIDYEGLMDRTTPGTLLGEPVRDLSLPDLLLSLSIHLVKHAIYLPSVVDRPDLARIILADGMLMYYLDVAEAVKRHGTEIDWALAVELARQGGAVDILGSVLCACCGLLDAPVPDWVLEELAVTGPSGIARQVMNGMADYEVVTYLGEQPSRMWDFLVITNGAFILRPIRLIDTAAYFFPDAGYLQRRYGSASLVTSARHLLRATGQYARLGADTLYFTWERHRRLKALNQSASLFNRLEVES